LSIVVYAESTFFISKNRKGNKERKKSLILAGTKK